MYQCQLTIFNTAYIIFNISRKFYELREILVLPVVLSIELGTICYVLIKSQGENIQPAEVTELKDNIKRTV